MYNRGTNGSVGQLLQTCDDCGPCGLRTVLSVALNPGSYWVVVDGFSSSSGNYRLAITCPTNSIVVGQLPCGGSGVQGNTSGGVSTVGHLAPEHYYAFTAQFNGVLSPSDDPMFLSGLLIWVP